MQEGTPTPTSTLIRDLIVFNLKLWMDGLKDVLLAPLSVGAGILDILGSEKDRGSRFYYVVRLGERFDDWLDLYSPVRADRSSFHRVFVDTEPSGSTDGATEGTTAPGAQHRPAV